MYLLGFDIGSSSVKVSLVDAALGKTVASDFSPKEEMQIIAHQAGWAEQDPEQWWTNLKIAYESVIAQSKVDKKAISAIGITYQMHGLVVVDKNKQVLRPSIIWCDSRAVPYGERAFQSMGQSYCLSHLLNSPGNFTAAKLAWIKDNEPEVFNRIDKMMLPGDYIAMKLSGECTTTVSGLSEGIFWDFAENKISEQLMNYFGFTASVIPTIVPTFGHQVELSAKMAEEFGLKPGTPVTYRAGDQPNNALSLNVFNPGEVASTAGTSGVVYGINDQIKSDQYSRVNNFAHVNHTPEQTRLGVLLCVNGTGILNSWVRQLTGGQNISYSEMNDWAARSMVGSKGISILPFGNGAERMLKNKELGASIHGVNFNIHQRGDIYRAAQEGIVFALAYGMEVMQQLGITTSVIRAGMANMYLSPIFRQTMASVTGATIELYNTDGSVGAAKAAGLGLGYYASTQEAFASLEKLEIVMPSNDCSPYQEAYQRWKKIVELQLTQH